MSRRVALLVALSGALLAALGIALVSTAAALVVAGLSIAGFAMLVEYKR